MLQRLLLAVLAALALTACAVSPAPSSAGTQSLAGHTDPPSPAKGMVSAADPRAAEAGAAMLRQGGSATDAAIAIMLALTVVEPQSSGIGGGGFLVLGNMAGDVATLDGRETAPAGATAQWFLDANGEPLSRRDAVMSGLSVGVPGNIALAAEAHRRHGKLPWATLFEPAIRLATDGWSITPRFHDFLSRRPQTAGRDPLGQALYFAPDGEPLPVGTLLRNPDLAATLERIAVQGPESFYSGDAAEALAAKVATDTDRAGAMTKKDVMAYRAKERPAVCGSYRAYRICGMGPPSSGATTVLAILGQMERFDIAALGPHDPTFWHLFAESQRLAYADRARYLADADFVTVPVKELTDPAYLQKRGALISPDSSLEVVRPGEFGLAFADVPQAPEYGTSHFAVVDKAGNAVSYTSTIEGPFGSGLMFGGFYLNNELTDFSFVPEQDGKPVANRVEGEKRPRSSMAPTIVYDPQGHLVLAIGAAGGGTIPVQVARSLIGFIDWSLPIAQALELPVLYAPGDTVIVETGTALETMMPALKALGHEKVAAYRLPIKTNAIAIDGSARTGAADPRSEGRAISE